MGFITSPTEFSDAECQARALNKPVDDAPLQDQTLPHNETEDHHDLEASTVVMNQAAGEETGEPV